MNASCNSCKSVCFSCACFKSWRATQSIYTEYNMYSADFATSKSAVYVLYHKYGVATISRLLKTLGLFCKRALYTRLYSAKETFNFKQPTNRSHPIANIVSYVAK